MSEYNSKADTLEHKAKVAAYLGEAAVDLIQRAKHHDDSKLGQFEMEGFDKMTPLLGSSTYGSDEYKGFLKELEPVLKHHYAHNRHHPEHFKNGVDDMTLFDVLEMLLDWKASTERHHDGNIRRSLEINTERFGISPQLSRIMANTIDYMKW